MVLKEAAVEVEHYDVLELAHGVEDLVDLCHWCGHVLDELVHSLTSSLVRRCFGLSFAFCFLVRKAGQMH